MGLVRVGASSWANPTLLKHSNFYPPSVRTPAERLRFYADRFPIVEVDSTYYRLPSEQMVAAWNQRTPADFIFNIKAFRAFTLHPTPPGALPADVRDTLPQTADLKTNLYWHRLPAGMRVDLWQGFRRALQPLAKAGKLGAILFQLPPWIHPSDESRQHLREARQALAEYRLAIEFRDASWVSSKNLDRTTEFLSQNELTFVCVDEPQVGRLLPPLALVTTPALAVVRFHGRNAEAWQTRDTATSERSRFLYVQRELAEWVPKIKQLATNTPETHVIFNNAYADYALRNARQFMELLAREGLLVKRAGAETAESC
jgi:uncharacterized protein YecE (DUF72 family)